MSHIDEKSINKLKTNKQGFASYLMMKINRPRGIVFIGIENKDFVFEIDECLVKVDLYLEYVLSDYSEFDKNLAYLGDTRRKQLLLLLKEK